MTPYQLYQNFALDPQEKNTSSPPLKFFPFDYILFLRSHFSTFAFFAKHKNLIPALFAITNHKNLYTFSINTREIIKSGTLV